MSNSLVLLTGATGYIGGRLISPLLDQGYRVRCLVRQPQNLKSRYRDTVDIVEGDLFDKDSLVKALRNVESAYYLVHSMDTKGEFLEKDRQAAKNFAEAASQNGVKRIIYLGGLGDSRNGAMSDHLKSRQEVGFVLREFAKDVQVLEFRSSIIIGSGSLSFEMIRTLCERLPIMVTPKWVKTPLQPLAVKDLIQYMLQALTVQVKGNPIFEIGGRDVVSYKDLMQEYSKQRRLHRYMIPVPVLTPRLSSLWLGLVTPVYARVGKKLVESATCPTVVRDFSAQHYFNVHPLSMKEAIASALRYEDRELAATRWIDSYTVEKTLTDSNVTSFGNRIVDSRCITVPVSADNAFSAIQRIGGKTGYYYGNWLWRLRGFIDLCLGGVGFRRGRRHPTELHPGDIIDFWRVEAIEPNQRLLLRAEMKVPGRAWLEFSVDGYQDFSLISQKAVFDPVGLLGLLYWYVLYPFHRLIFKGMLKGVAKEAMKGQVGIPEQFLKSDLFFKKSLMPVSVQKLFQWHERPGALQRLLPPWQHITIVKGSDSIHDGATVRIEVKQFFATFRWELMHQGYLKDVQFKDTQVKGPFRFWEHTHLFAPTPSKKSFLIDSLQYQLPGGKLGRWIFNPFFVTELKRLFDYRHQITAHDLKVENFYQGKAMKILVAGSSGFVGTDLIAFLQHAGHEVKRLVRKSKDLQPDEITWDPRNGIIDVKALEGFDAVINLAGENISKRWNEEVKKQILESREQTTRLLSKTLAQLENPPEVFINASAIGYYGNRGEETLTENSSSGKGFLAEVCRRWEGATQAAVQKGIRTVFLRIGIVLSPKGGALAKMLPPFKLGAGGVLGSGKQYMSWIALEDLIGIIYFLLKEKAIHGPINAVAPNPVTNQEFTKTLGKVLNRPTIIPAPEFMLKLVFGEMAEEMLLSSVKVKPQKLLVSDYPYTFPQLEPALKHMLGA